VAPTLRRRLGSLLYEALVVIAVGLVVVALFSLVTTAVPRLPHQRPLLLASCFAVFGGYFTYCWRHGQTLAMRAWKIRIEDARGHALSWGRACVRYLLAWVWVAPPLAFIAATRPPAGSLSGALGTASLAILGWAALWALAAVLHPRRQFWHDVASGTRLVPA